MVAWGDRERREALEQATRDGVDLLVVGGGITGAGVLRDAATRGLRSLLVERYDFAAGTSGRSSKLVHGGLRYIAEGQLGVTRESCRERDLLLQANPHLVQPLPFLFPSYRGGTPLWQVRAALWTYSALANFRRTARYEMFGRAGATAFCPDLRQDGLRGAGLYYDARVDDARLVLETLKSARALGAEAVNRAEVVAFERDREGRIQAVRVKDHQTDAVHRIEARVVVNAAGPAVERVRGLERVGGATRLRPAKGVHLVIPRQRIRTQGAVTFAAHDGRHLFLLPWDDVALIGTTDRFCDEIDEPVVTIDEVHYLLAAANEAFPRVALTTNDLRAVFAGVRPLAADDDADKPSNAVSREDRVELEASGLLSAFGGKLTTYRATGERVVDRALGLLPPERREAVGPSRTAELPLRENGFDGDELAAELGQRFGLDATRAEMLVRTWGAESKRLLEETPAALHRPVGESRFLLAEVAWTFRTECPLSLCDVLERRLRMALFAVGQGISELDEVVEVAAGAAGWDAERSRAEAAEYLAAVRRRYQIQIPRAAGRVAHSAAA